MINSETIFFPNSIEIERVKMPKNFELKNHKHSGIHLCLVTAGSFEEVTSSQVVNCKKQTTRISKPSAEHEIYFGSEGGECIIVQLNNRFSNLVNGSFHFKEYSFFNFYSNYIYDFFRKNNINEISPVTLEIRLRKLLAHCLSADEKEEPDWVKEIKSFIDANPAYSFNSSKMAEKAGVHRVHLSRSFSKYTGCTLREYIILKKLEAAHKILGERDLTISSVAYEAGFSDQSHFNKFFRRYFNTNPLLYRSKLISGVHVTNVQEIFNQAV